MSEFDETSGIEAVLKTLTAQEEQFIRLRFVIGTGREHTHKKVAHRFSLTGQQIRQIELTALRKLRHLPCSGKFGAFLTSSVLRKDESWKQDH